MDIQKNKLVLRVLLCISPYLFSIVNLLEPQGKGWKSFFSNEKIIL
jgi:hypothetical protein